MDRMSKVFKDSFCIRQPEVRNDYYKLRKLALDCGLEVRTVHAGKERYLQVRASERDRFMDAQDFVDNHINNIRKMALSSIERAERLGLNRISDSVQKSQLQTSIYDENSIPLKFLAGFAHQASRLTDNEIESANNELHNHVRLSKQNFYRLWKFYQLIGIKLKARGLDPSEFEINFKE